MAVRTTGAVPVALQGFEELDRARRKRIDALLRRLVRSVSAGGWALGLFDANGDLRDYDVSAAPVGAGKALALLSMVPLPGTPGPVALRAAAVGNEFGPVIGTAMPTGNGSVVLILLLPAKAEQPSPRRSDDVYRVARRLADEIADGMSRNGERAPERVRNTFQGFFLLNHELKVELAWPSHDGEPGALAELIQPSGDRLPGIVERAVRRLTSSWSFARAGTCSTGVAFPLPGLAIRVVPMTGAGPEVLVGVFVERSVDAHSIERAAATFRISSRERDVLHALLDGDSVAEIAASLNLAESTVNDHIARMITKTNARNRIEMAAMLLGWPDMRAETSGDAGTSTKEAKSENQGRPVASQVRCSWRYNLAAPVLGEETVG